MGRLRQRMILEQSKTPTSLTDPWTENLQATLDLINATQDAIAKAIPYEKRKEHPRMNWEELWWKNGQEDFSLKMMAQLAKAYAEIAMLIEWAGPTTELDLSLGKHRER